MSTPVITIFVRHSAKDGKPCKYADDEFSRRCNCRKHFRWTQSGTQYRRKAAGVRERLRGFLRYCYEAQWLDRIPPVPRVQADEPPTLPLTDAEYKSVLAAIDTVRPLRFDAKGVTRLLSPETKQRLSALIQLMRWSGLAINDAVKLRRADIIHEKGKRVYRVVTVRQKTGTHVSVPLPPEVARIILAVPPASPEYIFWTGSKGRSAAAMWGSRYMRPLFETAGSARDTWSATDSGTRLPRTS